MAGPRGRRAYRTAGVALIAAALPVVSGSCISKDAPGVRETSVVREQADYCAILPDSIGLYPGNPVTQMGYRIGKVKTVSPSPNDVRVDFTLNEQRRLPADVKAVIRSPSILADRSLELVGNYESGPQLSTRGCIPLSRSATPKSLSEVIGSATTFINTINPDGSTNVGDAVQRVDQSFHGTGAGINKLLTTASSLLDSPDQAISDIGSVIANTEHLTSVLTDLRGPLKQILYDAQASTQDVTLAVNGGYEIASIVDPLLGLMSEIETILGQELQFTLDTVSVTVRKLSAHAPRLANLLNPVPWWINSMANIINNHLWQTIRYRPPLYRIRTPDGVALCNIMNASMRGSCANVQGTPYAVDVALLQYVLTQAAKP
ncbi:MlaD family protein [Mycobacterium sp.]|uniref:MlaD family protein n=1 Tax=Mycobacterium sp. TaxID=1785 RepID=UPI003C74663E